MDLEPFRRKNPPPPRDASTATGSGAAVGLGTLAGVSASMGAQQLITGEIDWSDPVAWPSGGGN